MALNKKQEKYIWIGLIIFILMGLFPPWIHLYVLGLTRMYDYDPPVMGEAIYTCIGYGFILTPPADSLCVDLTRLIPQWLILAVITAWVVYLRRNKPPESAKK